ncbi:MerC family mercury resistance protein [Marivirga lumbricoides]|uniref:MerC family mercury resistance protein n=1 Tax=Marivirga lumbricoides TaxID=1046115 RepID=UPI001669141D
MRNRILNFPLDIFGILASLLCAIHCLALPILLSISSLAFLDFLANPWIEYSVIIISILIAFYSLLPAYKQHRKITPLIIVLTGFLLIAIGQSEFFIVPEFTFTSGGAICIALAHSINWRILMKSKKK